MQRAVDDHELLHKAQAYRERAKELCKCAAGTGDGDVRQALTSLAQAYENLAQLIVKHRYAASPSQGGEPLPDIAEVL